MKQAMPLYPDIGIYLRGIRRELLREAQQAQADPMRDINCRRIAETLVHLVVAQEHAEEITSAILPRLMILLKETVAQMQALALEIPELVTAVLAEDSATASREDAVRVYDNCSRGLVECLAAISRQASNAEVTALGEATGQAASALEDELRAARAKAAANVRDAKVDSVESVDEEPITDAGLTDCLRLKLPQYPDIRAVNVRQQIGQNTKEIFFSTIAGCPNWPEQVVLRRNAAVDNVGNRVSDEFELLAFLHREGVCVPRPLLAANETPQIGRPFIISERVNGKPLDVFSLGAEAIPAALELAAHLGKVHSLDTAGLPESRRLYGDTTRDRTLAMVDRFYRMTKDAEFQPVLTQEAAFAWLRANVDRIGTQTTVAHGDFDFRNVLFENNRLSAILDWELAHLGHPAEDLGYCRPQVESIMDWDKFLDTYYQHGGVEVRDEEVRYFQIYGDVFRLSTMYPATVNFINGESDNFLMGTLGLIEFPMLMSRLAELLKREA